MRYNGKYIGVSELVQYDAFECIINYCASKLELVNSTQNDTLPFLFWLSFSIRSIYHVASYCNK